MPRDTIKFILNGKDVTLKEVSANTTLLEFLRQDQHLTGSKEGCAEGDCGACTVLVGRLKKGLLKYENVNACIRFLASCDGCHVVTIEHLQGEDGGLHPVQQAMVDFHGSQCGFCTPGIVMSLYALWMQTLQPTYKQVESALQGNLCRCTGYVPILNAAMSFGDYSGPEADRLLQEQQSITSRLLALTDGQRVETGPADNRAILPANLDDLATCLLEHDTYTIVAGSTDVGLWVTKFLRSISPAIFISHLDELQDIQDMDDTIILGGGVSYTDSHDVLANAFPHLRSYWSRIAGWQVRNQGTVGGNIANGSPIGDIPPVLIALDAKVVLRRGSDRREVDLQDYFIEYGKQDLAPGEFLESVVIPKASANMRNAAYKVSKRKDEDITAVAVGVSVELEGSQITACRIAYGGMAATPKRAWAAEAVLIGSSWSEANFEAAAEAITQDFSPMTDMRASSEYRTLVAQNLLRRFYLEQSAETVSASCDAD